MYTEEDLLEAVDILIEEYGYDEDEAIDMVNEAYEEELSTISEAIDILIENYGYDEDEAIDLISEAYEEPEIKSKSDAVAYNIGRGAGVGIAVGGGLYALKKDKENRGRRKERRALRNSHKREMDSIRKTGRRTTEQEPEQPVAESGNTQGPYDSQYLSKTGRNIAYGSGVALGALGAIGYGRYASRRADKRHSKKMDRLRRKYNRIEDKEKAKYKVKNSGGEQ